MWYFLVASVFAEPVPCRTMLRWNEWQSKPFREPVVYKQERDHVDSFDTPSDQIEFSEHFALHWGTGFSGMERISQILELLETTWELQIDVWGMEPPTEDVYFNVYLGSTGDGLPNDLGVAGYYDVDSNGVPMVVLGTYVTDSWSIAKTTVPHEFFHAVQHRTGQYTQFSDRWYWESSAVWVEQEVLPAHPSHADFLFGYALRPQLPLAYFELFSSGNIEEYHAYGAFIFLQYLTDVYQSNGDVVASWMDFDIQHEQTMETPLEWWNDHLASQDLVLGEIVSEMSAHNVHWTYDNHLIYQSQVDAYVSQDQSLDERWVGNLSVQSGEVSVPSGLRPGAFGYNQWSIDVGSLDSLDVRIDGTTVGDHFTPVEWRIQIVRQYGENVEIQSFLPSNGEGVWRLSNLDLDADAVTLVVLADALDAHIDERFTYTVSVSEPTEGAEVSKRLGCITQPESGLLILWVPVLGLGIRRRRDSDLLRVQ
jgi:hypothetical protein